MAGECVYWEGSDFTGACQDFSTCPGKADRKDGAGLPLLPFLWGGLAASAGVYRSLPTSGIWDTDMSVPVAPRWPTSPMEGPFWTPNAGSP